LLDPAKFNDLNAMARLQTGLSTVRAALARFAAHAVVNFAASVDTNVGIREKVCAIAMDIRLPEEPLPAFVWVRS